MPNLIDKLEAEAQKFMHKRIPIEDKLKNDIYDEIIKTKVDIENYFKSLPYVNLNYLSSIIENEIKFIINKRMNNEIDILSNSINNSFEVGQRQAERFLTITRENTNPILQDEKSKNEALLALLLFGKALIEGLNNDLLSRVEKDLYSAYILSKSKNEPSINSLYRDTDNDSTINTQLSGIILSQYIAPTFDNIKGRADTIAQTETNRALNHAIALSYISARREIPELRVKWVEIRDQKLCKVCAERAEGGPDGDGVYNIGSIEPPPIHPNCRCVLIPFLYRWFTF